MKIKKIKFPLIFFSVIILIGSCKKDNSESLLEEEISENVIIISDATNNSLLEVSNDYLVFDAEQNQTSSFEIGTILASDIHQNAKNGYLRRIESIEEVNGNVKINTSQSLIVDAVKNCDVNYNYKINNSDVIEIDESGEDITNRNNFDQSNVSINFNLNNKVIYDEDNDLSTTQDQITLNGSVEIELDVNFKLRIRNRSVEEFVLSNTISSTIESTVGFDLNFANISEQFVLKTFKLAPFTIPVAGLPVPIAKQWLVILVGIDGSLSLGISYTASNFSTATYGMNYQKDNGWSLINDLTNEYNYDIPSFSFTGEIEPWLQARYEIRPYGLPESKIALYVKPSINIKGEINSSIPNYTQIETNWCIDAGAYAQLSIFDNTVASLDQSFFNGNNCFPLFKSIEPASQPNPFNQESDVSLNGILSFLPGSNTPAGSRFKVYFDENPNPSTEYLLSSNVSSLPYSNLIDGTTYYWRVETLGINNEVIANSEIWSFTTDDVSLDDFQSQGTVYSSGTPINSFSFSQDGMHLYLTTNGSVLHYELTSPYSFSSIGSPDETFQPNSSQGGSNFAEEVLVNDNGTTLYVKANGSGGFDYFQQYSLNSPYSIQNPIYVDKKNLNSRNQKMSLSTDNSKLYIAYHDFFSTIIRHIIEFEFAIPNDITSITAVETTPIIYQNGQSGGISYDILENQKSIYVTNFPGDGILNKYLLDIPGDISSVNLNPQSSIQLEFGEKIIKVTGNETKFFTLLNSSGQYIIKEYIRN